MSHAPLTPDDPRLTAYVLGELDDADLAAVEAGLAADPTCRQVVEELQQTSALMLQALHAEPIPSLSDGQREAIRQAALQPAPQRLVRVSEPARPGRRGILPLMAATVACAALLVGVSAWNFEQPADQMQARLDDMQNHENLYAQLDAYYDAKDGLATVDESERDELRRLSRLHMLNSETDIAQKFQTKLGRDFRESKELQQIIVQDGEAPDVKMTVEEAQEAQVQLESIRPQLTAEQLQGLATMTTRPAVPGNLGDVVDPSVDYLQDSFLGQSGSAPSTNQSIRGRFTGGLGPQGGNPISATDKPVSGPVTSSPGGGQGAGGYGESVVEEGFQKRSTQLGRQTRGGEAKEGEAATHFFFRYDTSSASQGQGMPQLNSPQQAGEQDRFGTTPATSPAPAGEPAPAGMAGKPTSMSLSDPYGRGSAVEFGLVPQQEAATRGEALYENLAGTPQQGGMPGQNVDGLWIDLDSDAAGVANGTQIVPYFAFTDLQRLAERESTRDAAGLAAGTTENFNGVPVTTSNSATFSDEMLLGVRLRNESEARGLQEQPLAKGWGRVPLSWEDGRWYTITAEGRKLAVNIPGTEAYAPIVENEFLAPTDQPLSTFGLDVDTASYANVRRFLMEQRRFPPPDAVRIEEMVNYFAYSDPAPTGDEPLAVHLESNACPWNTEHHLVRIGLKAKQIDLADRPATTLVFLVDTSGSMRDENKLPLVKDSLRILVDEMTENDRIAIVTYNDNAGLLLDSTSGEQTDEIMAAIDGLEADGSTNGEAGLKLAYEVATQHFIKSGQNRVILCTDGDFNVGTSDTDPLVKMISDKRQSGVFLSICGYGSGNIKDEKLERIADTGNGQYHYVDNHKEARKVFLDELTGTLYTVAKDVKLQVEFNPAQVAWYRLLGYENRTLAAEDFNNDRVDSGDMGAGHSVTALYEVVPVGVRKAEPPGEQSPEQPKVDPLKYQKSEVGDQKSDGADPLTATQRGAPGHAPNDREAETSDFAEWLTVKLRYKQPDGNESVKREFPLVPESGDDKSPSTDLEWSAAVASFGMLLRSSKHAGQSSLENVLELAQGAKGPDESGRRREFIDMVLQTRSLVRSLHGSPTPEPRELSSTDARQKATVGGKYDDLLDKFEVRDDASRYGEFHDYGWSEDKTHAGREGLPAGYWVYVFPDWYIWAETVSKRE